LAGARFLGGLARIAFTIVVVTAGVLLCRWITPVYAWSSPHGRAFLLPPIRSWFTIH